MPSSVYSVVLWEYENPLTGFPLSVTSPPVPDGHVWVIRDIAVSSGIAQSLLAIGQLELYANSILIWATPFGATIRGQPYGVQQLRQVMGPGETMYAQSAATVWSLRVSGFQLTLP